MGVLQETRKSRMHGSDRERKKLWQEDRELIAELLKSDPKMSDKSVCNATGTHHTTVASERQRLEEAGIIPLFNKRRGSDGRVWGMRKYQRRSIPYWLRNAADDAQAINTDTLIVVRDLLLAVEARIEDMLFIRDLIMLIEARMDDQRALLAQIRNGRYRQDQPAAERNGRVRERR